MEFVETKIAGAYAISLQPHRDERGYFARAWCHRELEERGLNPRIAQCNIGYNARKGTIRGIHLQSAPFEEVRIFRCTSGGVFDVIVDLRPQSPSYGRCHTMEMWARDQNLLYIPPGIAHGYQTLVDDTEVYYQVSEFYHPECSDGLRYNDPALGIDWPLEVSVIADRDLTWPDLRSRGGSSSPATGEVLH